MYVLLILFQINDASKFSYSLITTSGCSMMKRARQVHLLYCLEDIDFQYNNVYFATSCFGFPSSGILISLKASDLQNCLRQRCVSGCTFRYFTVTYILCSCSIITDPFINDSELFNNVRTFHAVHLFEL